MWRPLSAMLPGWLCIAPDLRVVGHRLRDSGVRGMSVFADDVAALLDELGVTDAVLCGHSMGGYVAFEMLRRHAHRCRGLMLCHTRAEADSAEARQGRDEMARCVLDAGTSLLIERMLPTLLAPRALETAPRVVRHVEVMIARNHVGGIIDSLGAMKHRADSTGLLPNIAVRSLVVAGARDQLIPVSQCRSMAAAMPRAEFTVLPRAGHLGPLEQPVALGRVVREFLESLG